MHVSALTVDLNWLLQLVFSLLLILVGFLYLLKNTASKYFVVDGTFDSPSMPASTSSGRTALAGVDMNSAGGTSTSDRCAVCGKTTTKNCARCKAVKYCSVSCQHEHWQSGHQKKCKNLQLSSKENTKPSSSWRGLSLVPSIGSSKAQKQVDKVLYPYDDFVYLFNWDKGAFPPCGLLNCGNSCYANVILQCLAHTRPLVAYLLERGHLRECRRNEWCFFCELQRHIERAIISQHPFSPINILSRLPSIGANLGYGRQEDAHEFMRFAVDTMQSVCLDEHGGEKMIHPKSQETTIIQHIFGGQLQSQVICAQCNQVSNQYENMMDLTVEIQGNATSLEECLDQFTVKEWLEGDNLYKCDRCNDYVKACKRLTIRQAPNILTIALKRFESGRFGKINKRISFPEYLDLTPYMSEEGDGMDKYKLFAVVVHIDMLNASFFGHYICYTKDFQGSWFRIDDSKVAGVELDEVLSQGAYMVLYSRVCARPTCLKTFEASGKLRSEADALPSAAQQSCQIDPLNSDSMVPTVSHAESNSLVSQVNLDSNGSLIQKETSLLPAVREIEVGDQDQPTRLQTVEALGKQRLGVDEPASEATQNCLIESPDSNSVVPTESHTESSSLASQSIPQSNGFLIRDETYLQPAISDIEGEDQDQTSLPVSRNVEIVESEAFAIGQTDGTACALLSSPSEAWTLTSEPLSNGPYHYDMSPLNETKTEPPMGILNGEDKRSPPVNGSNGTCNGFGDMVRRRNIDPSGPTILDSNFGNSDRILNDEEVESAASTGAANLYNRIYNGYPVSETDSSNNGSSRDKFCSDPIQTLNVQHLNDMEVDPVKINGSVNHSLPSCFTMDTRSSHDCNAQDMQCSSAVKKSIRDVDDMDIDDTCVN